MTNFRPKLWTSLSAAALISAGGLAACSDDAAKAPAATEATPAAATGAPAADLAGEAGETGAQGAYDTVSADSRRALRIAHLSGFVLAAQAAGPIEGSESAAALVGQGMAEVFDPGAPEFKAAGVDEAVLRKAAETGASADLTAALANLDAAADKAGGDPAQVTKGMTSIAGGLYGEVLKDGAIDPIEYQHSLGAALSAQAVAKRATLSAALPELKKLTDLWSGPVAPEDPAKVTPAGQVLAQASRVELALSN